MTAREAMRAALAWLDAHPMVSPSCVAVEWVPPPAGGECVWHAEVSVPYAVVSAQPGQLVRTPYEASQLVRWSVEVAPGVHLTTLETLPRTVPTTLPPERPWTLDDEVLP